MPIKDDGVLRSFESGATRDTSEGKLLYHLFLSPVVLTQYAKFMLMNRLQSDGKLRDGDNWTKGIDMDVYESSMGRHYHELWTMLRSNDLGARGTQIELIGAAMGLLFNVMGYVHEFLKLEPMIRFDEDEPTAEMRERQEKVAKAQSVAEDINFDVPEPTADVFTQPAVMDDRSVAMRQFVDLVSSFDMEDCIMTQEEMDKAKKEAATAELRQTLTNVWNDYQEFKADKPHTCETCHVESPKEPGVCRNRTSEYCSLDGHGSPPDCCPHLEEIADCLFCDEKAYRCNCDIRDHGLTKMKPEENFEDYCYDDGDPIRYCMYCGVAEGFLHLPSCSIRNPIENTEFDPTYPLDLGEIVEPEATEEVVFMDDPVKNCSSCRWSSYKASADPCKSCVLRANLTSEKYSLWMKEE